MLSLIDSEISLITYYIHSITSLQTLFMFNDNFTPSICFQSSTFYNHKTMLLSSHVMTSLHSMKNILIRLNVLGVMIKDNMGFCNRSVSLHIYFGVYLYQAAAFWTEFEEGICISSETEIPRLDLVRKCSNWRCTNQPLWALEVMMH